MMLKITITTFFIAISLFVGIPDTQAAIATGTIESEVLDAGFGAVWNEMSWTASTSASSTITMKARTATTSDMASATDWSSCNSLTSGVDISSNNCVSDGHRYIQYYALLSSEYTSTSTYASPELYDVDISYGEIGVLVSSPFDALADDAELLEVRWSETLPAGTDIAIQLRSSADASTWTDWLGPDGTTDDYFTDTSGGETLPSVLTDGTGERYFQYKAILSSGGVDYPVLSDISVDYSAIVPVVNSYSPPYIGSNASGTVSVVISGSDFSVASMIVKNREMTIDISNIVTSSDTISFDVDTSQLYGGPIDITMTNANGASITNSDFYVNEYRGAYTSIIRDISTNPYDNVISWTDSTTASTTLLVKVRTDNSSDMSTASDWSSCPTITSGSLIASNSCADDGDPYVQYYLELRSVYGSSTGYITPELSSISIASNISYSATGTLVSSPFNTGSEVNALHTLTWSQTEPANTDIVFQIRTAPDSGGSPGTWTEWLGPFAGSSYRDFRGKSGINLEHNDGQGDQWIQYRATLSSDGQNTPVLSDVNLEYGDKLYSTQIIKDGAVFKDGVIMR